MAILPAAAGVGDCVLHRQALCMLGGPYVLIGDQRVAIPEGGQRLLAYVALHCGQVDRRRVAGVLWPEGGDDRASGNLRSALWRLRRSGLDLLLVDARSLALQPSTTVDLDSLNAWMARLVGGTATVSDLALAGRDEAVSELLPGWYDDWVIFERERLRQRLMHALEALSTALVDRGRHAEAVEAAMSVVHIEPLRESAQRVLVEAHLAEGNLVEARRVVDRYDALCRDELGVRPSAAFWGLVGPVRRASRLTCERDARVTVPALPSRGRWEM